MPSTTSSENPAGALPRQRSRSDVRQLQVAVLVSVLVGIVTVPLFHRLATDPAARVLGLNDLPPHLLRAEAMTLWPFQAAEPHFLFALLVVLLRWAAGADAATIVLSLAVTASAATLFRIAYTGERTTSLSVRFGVAWVALCTLGESPMALRSLWDSASTSGPTFLPLQLWGNPTSVLLLPFGFLFVHLFIKRVTTGEPAVGFGVALVPAVTALSILAKPNFMLAALPACAAYVVVVRRWDRPTWRWFGLQVVLPASAVLGWQLWFSLNWTRPALPEFGMTEEEPGILWKPFEILLKIAAFGPQVWVLLWVVALAAATGRRRYIRDPHVKLSLMIFGGALLPNVLVIDSVDAEGSNFLFGIYFACAFLFAFSSRFMLMTLQEARDEGRYRPIVASLFWVGAAATLAAGVATYLDAVGAFAP